MIIESLDRTLFELLRREVVAQGYLPDASLYTGNNAAYTAAKDLLRLTLPNKQLIEVFGVGAPESRDEKTVNKIFINRIGFMKGNLGGFPVTRFVPSGNTFNKEMMPAESKNVKYEIRHISNNVYYDRIMLELVEKVFGSRSYQKTWNSTDVAFTGDAVLIEQEDYIDVTSTNLIEKVFKYMIYDIWIEPTRVVTANIVPMTTVHLELYYDTDPNVHEDINISSSS